MPTLERRGRGRHEPFFYHRENQLSELMRMHEEDKETGTTRLVTMGADLAEQKGVLIFDRYYGSKMWDLRQMKVLPLRERMMIAIAVIIWKKRGVGLM